MDIEQWLTENPFSPEVNATGLPPAMEEPDTVETRFSISPDPEQLKEFDIDQFLKDNPFTPDVPTSGDTRPIGTADQMIPADKREQGLYALGGGIMEAASEIPLAIAEKFAPSAGYTPGELRSSPQDKVRAEQFAQQEFSESMAQDPYTKSMSQIGYGMGTVADPIMDTGIAAAPMALRGLRGLPGLAEEAGEILGRKLANPEAGNISIPALRKTQEAFENVGLKGAEWDAVKGEFREQLPRIGQEGEEIANLSPRTKNRLFREQDPQVTKGYTPSDYFKVLKDDPWFQSIKTSKPDGEGVFDQLKIMSEVERAYAPGARPNKYSAGLGVKGSTTAKTRQSAAIDIQSNNAKTGDSEILSSDTIRGCGNNCNTCFANTGCHKSKIAHNEPVPAKLKGKVKEGQIMRVGTNGDPAIDWSHSNKEISEVFERSKGNVSPETNLFGITKLQSIEGFDPAIWKNLEVSLDPLNPDHMRITMANIQRLKKMNPDINISARIRSFKSKNPALQKSQDQAVQFANQHDLEILETKMRFKNKEYEDILDLDKNAYKGKGPQRVYDGESILKETNPDAQKKITVCGEGVIEAQCVTCRGCEKVGTKTIPKDWKATPEYIEGLISKGAITGDNVEKARKAVR